MTVTLWDDKMKAAAMKDAAQVVKLTERVSELEAALKPFAAAWRYAVKSSPKVTIGQLGALAAHDVSGVHFMAAAATLDGNKKLGSAGTSARP